MKRIVEVQPKPEYKVWLQFEDGVEGEVDLSHLAGYGVFELWDKPGAFSDVFIDPDTNTIAWAGGIDLCPDSLYAEVTGIPIDDKAHQAIEADSGETEKIRSNY